MFDDGVLKQGTYGQIEAVVDPNESEYIRSTNAQASKARVTGHGGGEELNQSINRMNH